MEATAAVFIGLTVLAWTGHLSDHDFYVFALGLLSAGPIAWLHEGEVMSETLAELRRVLTVH